MAKASTRDIDAAGELLSILNAIDARFGGPWLHEGAPEDLHELLGEDDFDPDNQLHLQVLYNHLARLLDRVPSFHNRIIAGMCYVIMHEANEIVDPASDVLDLHPKLKAALADAERLDYLDQLNQLNNERYSSNYGWEIDWNHNRIALRDSNFPKRSVREAIDEYRRRHPGLLKEKAKSGGEL